MFSFKDTEDVNTREHFSKMLYFLLLATVRDICHVYNT